MGRREVHIVAMIHLPSDKPVDAQHIAAYTTWFSFMKCDLVSLSHKIKIKLTYPILAVPYCGEADNQTQGPSHIPRPEPMSNYKTNEQCSRGCDGSAV